MRVAFALLSLVTMACGSADPSRCAESEAQSSSDAREAPPCEATTKLPATSKAKPAMDGDSKDPIYFDVEP